MTSTSSRPNGLNRSNSTLKRTSGWFSNAKANLKASISSTGGGTGSGGGAIPPTSNSTLPRSSEFGVIKETGEKESSTVKAKGEGGGGVLARRESTTRGRGGLKIQTTQPSATSVQTTNTLVEEKKEKVENVIVGQTTTKRIIGAVQDEWPLYSCVLSCSFILIQSLMCGREQAQVPSSRLYNPRTDRFRFFFSSSPRLVLTTRFTYSHALRSQDYRRRSTLECRGHR